MLLVICGTTGAKKLLDKASALSWGTLATSSFNPIHLKALIAQARKRLHRRGGISSRQVPHRRQFTHRRQLPDRRQLPNRPRWVLPSTTRTHVNHVFSCKQKTAVTLAVLACFVTTLTSARPRRDRARASETGFAPRFYKLDGCSDRMPDISDQLAGAHPETPANDSS